MKKIFTMITVCAATLAMHTASAGTFPTNVGKINSNEKVATPSVGYANPALRAVTCDTLINETARDTAFIFLSDTPNIGYFSGNGAFDIGGTFAPTLGIGEKFTAPSTGMHVTGAFVVFGKPVIKSTDSSKVVTAYVYDTTGTSLAFNEYAPGSVLDSATTTLRAIAASGQVFFTFTHHAAIAGKGFFVTVAFPQVTGDTIEVATNQGTTGDGHAYIEVSYTGQHIWASYDSVSNGEIGAYIIPIVCTPASGIENINGVSNFNLFPNPSNGIFTAALNLESASDVTITVLDITGNKIYESTETSVKDINKQIDLSSAAAGLYFVNVKTATGSVNQRIVIK